MPYQMLEKGFRTMLQRLYTDSCNIYRSEDAVISNGSVRREYREIALGTACRISRLMSRKASVQHGVPMDEIATKAHLYLAPETDIIAGDEVQVIRRGRVFAYCVGEVYRYATHLECLLHKTEEV